MKRDSPRGRASPSARPSDDGRWDERRAYYSLDPVAFVEHELGETPSPDQASLLRDYADLSNKHFIVTAGRGGGKTLSVSWLVAWSSAVLPLYFGRYDIIILGGSGQQSRIVYDYFRSYIDRTPLLNEKLVGDPKRSQTTFLDSNIRPIPASERQVRGPHPELLVIDEVCTADDSIVRSALLQVAGSRHGRIVLLSTPHENFGIFRDYWDMASEWGYRKHGPWSLERCPWITKEQLDHWRTTLPPDVYKTEVQGEFSTARSQVFDMESIDRAVAFGKFGMDPAYPCDTGVDWGYTAPAKTVFVKGQWKGDTLYIPGPEVIHQYTRYHEIMAFLEKEYFPKHKGTVYADSSHMGENDRIEQMGEDIFKVRFSAVKKQLVGHLQWLLTHDKIRISADCEVLIRELRRYSRVQRQGKEYFRKGDDDTVDALLCLMYPMVESGGPPTERDEIGWISY